MNPVMELISLMFIYGSGFFIVGVLFVKGLKGFNKEGRKYLSRKSLIGVDFHKQGDWNE